MDDEYSLFAQGGEQGAVADERYQSWSVRTHTHNTSTWSATEIGLTSRAAPGSSKAARVCGLMSHPSRLNPLRAMRRAIGAPNIPKPTKPTFIARLSSKSSRVNPVRTIAEQDSIVNHASRQKRGRSKMRLFSDERHAVQQPAAVRSNAA